MGNKFFFTHELKKLIDVPKEIVTRMLFGKLSSEFDEFGKDM